MTLPLRVLTGAMAASCWWTLAPTAAGCGFQVAAPTCCSGAKNVSCMGAAKLPLEHRLPTRTRRPCVFQCPETAAPSQLSLENNIDKQIWLKNYPAGMPADINPDLFTSIPDLLEKTATRFADRPAFHNLGHTISYAELERLTREFAAFLQGLPGMAQGDRVAI